MTTARGATSRGNIIPTEPGPLGLQKQQTGGWVARIVAALRGRIDGLWQALEAVTDSRDGRGVRYQLPLLLALALLAATAGAKTFLEIAEHAADLPVGLLTELGACSWAGTRRAGPGTGAGQGRS
ncbi:transposase family protein [Saccharopolyspora hattusasensis]|uniref:transposase family protein n=1 Tax=Saccharopolyspora hattusasensis TaxID=1128679 RepID=UPI003D952840